MNFLYIKKNVSVLSLLVVFTFLGVSSCSYRITRTYAKPPVAENAADCQTMIVKQKDLFGVDVDFKGSIKLTMPDLQQIAPKRRHMHYFHRKPVAWEPTW